MRQIQLKITQKWRESDRVREKTEEKQKERRENDNIISDRISNDC